MLVEIMKLFTFQYGGLKTQPRKLVEGHSLQFTFQYGRLKTLFPLPPAPPELRLHSNMDD